MRTRTFVGILTGVLSIALLLQLGIYAYDNIIISSPNPIADEQEEPGMVTAFLVAKPNLIVDGSALSKVEIWAVPAGTGVLEEDYQLLGNATLQPGSDALTQVWALPIPEDPVLATEIFAKGFDMKGEFAGQMSLPYLGSTQVFNAVWGGSPKGPAAPNPSVQRQFSFVLKVGEKATVGGLSVSLVEIENDSRCPRNAVCIWAGEVTAKVQLIAGNRAETVTLHSMSAPSTFGSYKIGITGVSPAKLNNQPEQAEYRLTFSVERI